MKLEARDPRDVVVTRDQFAAERPRDAGDQRIGSGDRLAPVEQFGANGGGLPSSLFVERDGLSPLQCTRHRSDRLTGSVRPEDARVQFVEGDRRNGVLRVRVRLQVVERVPLFVEVIDEEARFGLSFPAVSAAGDRALAFAEAPVEFVAHRRDVVGEVGPGERAEPAPEIGGVRPVFDLVGPPHDGSPADLLARGSTALFQLPEPLPGRGARAVERVGDLGRGERLVRILAIAEHLEDVLGSDLRPGTYKKLTKNHFLNVFEYA